MIYVDLQQNRETKNRENIIKNIFKNQEKIVSLHECQEPRFRKNNFKIRVANKKIICRDILQIEKPNSLKSIVNIVAKISVLPVAVIAYSIRSMVDITATLAADIQVNERKISTIKAFSVGAIAILVCVPIGISNCISDIFKDKCPATKFCSGGIKKINFLESKDFTENLFFLLDKSKVLNFLCKVIFSPIALITHSLKELTYTSTLLVTISEKRNIDVEPVLAIFIGIFSLIVFIPKGVLSCIVDILNFKCSFKKFCEGGKNDIDLSAEVMENNWYKKYLLGVSVLKFTK